MTVHKFFKMTVFENYFGSFNFAVDNTICYCRRKNIILSQAYSKKIGQYFAAYRGWMLVIYIGILCQLRKNIRYL